MKKGKISKSKLNWPKFPPGKFGYSFGPRTRVIILLSSGLNDLRRRTKLTLSLNGIDAS